GGLAAARGADEDDELAIFDRQVEAVDGRHIALIGLLDGIERYRCHWLFLGFDEAFAEKALHEKDDEDGGQHGQHDGGHDKVPRRFTIGNGQHALDAHDDGVELLLGGDEQRPEILNPTEDEHDHEQRGDVGYRNGDQDVLEEFERPGAIDA